MFKKVLAIIMICVFALSLGTIANAEDAITWQFDSKTKVLTISGSGKMTSAPWNDEIDIDNVEKIVIQNGITSICDNAFCIFTEEGDMIPYKKLKTVEIPDSVTEIGVRAFAWAEKLTNVTLPSNIKKLGMIAFVGTGISTITIPPTLTKWDRTVFAYCSNLSSVTISQGLTTIPEFSFYGCESLTGVTVPDSVISIEGYAFGECTSLEWIEIPYGVAKIGEYAFDGDTMLTTLTIPASVKELDGFALNNYSTQTVVYRGTKAMWDSIKKGEDVICENTQLVCNSDALDFKVNITGEQVDFSWNMVPGVLSYGLAVFNGDEYVTGTEINEIYGDMSFICLLEDGKYTARLMLLTADFSGSSEFIDFYVGESGLSQTYALTVLNGEMTDGRFYAEAEIVERFDRSANDMYIIAVYKDGIMLDMVYITGDLIPCQPFKFGGILEGCEGAELKAFVWDSMEGMQTLSNVVEK